MIKKIVLNKRALLTMCLSGTMILSGCSDMETSDDFYKSFNVIVENNGENVSIVGVKSYCNYGTNQVLFVTNDDLKVVTSTDDVQLLHVKDEKAFNSYVYSLASNDSNNVISYDEIQGLDINYTEEYWNKLVFGTSYSYNKAIILSEEMATIINFDNCIIGDKKVQFRLFDDTVILTDAKNVKLINDDEASSDSLKNYALSLVGDSNKVIVYDGVKSK